ncbi:mycofactocin biosynthesis peptidyl-dipeptidase MftE [Mycobacteroides chelonae]|uniref:Mycofactocin biosynthesis peptidyl-dipeptidase MftE n=1 Tax=Mycobacteroides chelonae TaxID=1774 RepID=A0AB73U6G0_MYCCH|nr:mycofactocin biosynthesis peptidyl-dipeptidase MftE [Mycobacteroides chelonae]MEC4842332.1 mycofactocin biosynthesis peptidyl-dipeptidase MftE [Mycobacteroides chelonae]MEC4847170.1 mycofactocin biosynthesis peptidyl-dipeptidase MftE [Mycobacteroides chelonae]OLT80271.1 mycofactocin system creatininase family protein [Mycobacteroides chelonae]QDF72197.1 mycofactocin biosynthesis peptidyl-dipeptidase MftE [Mycobacteroides chelonae]WED91070.1 mycofactocin biosynthesis peptidyl-dipeptidase Mft
MSSAYHRRVAVPTVLSTAISPELADEAITLFTPLGSTEQHGPHLPLDTDTRIANAVATAAAGELAADTGDGRTALAPAIAYGSSGEHQSFAGTISIGTEALTRVLVEYARSATQWCRRIVFVNGHGGNIEATVSAVRLLRSEGRDIAWWACAVEGGDAHAGHVETSLLLHISPENVRREEVLAGNSAPLRELMAPMRAGGVAAVSAIGVLGDPTTASSQEGARMLATMTRQCADAVRRWTPDADGRLV